MIDESQRKQSPGCRTICRSGNVGLPATFPRYETVAGSARAFASPGRRKLIVSSYPKASAIRLSVSMFGRC